MYMETERLILRAFCPEDASDLQAILGDAQTMEYVEPPYDPARTAAFLRAFCIDQKGALAAVHRESQKVIGYVLFHPLEPDVYEMGWIFNRTYWGVGYAYEACREVMEFAFSTLQVQRIVAETADPVRSVGLMRKLGMTLVGMEPGREGDLYCYERSRTDA